MGMKTSRIDESRRKLTKAFYLSLGAYMEQEAKKGDSWRDQSLGEAYAHLSHELKEIRGNINNNDLTHLVHNASDAVILATILLSRAMEMAGMEEGYGEEGKEDEEEK